VRIAIGSDHAGFPLKEELRHRLKSEGHDVVDYGCHSTESVDYPDTAIPVADAVRRGEVDRGILMCGTGIGMSITANKVPGIRAALCGESYAARLAREHNDANVLALGGRITGPELANEIVRVFLGTSFAGGRHSRRVEKIAASEHRFEPARPA